MAIYGFRGLGWLVACAVVAPTCYVVTSHGAAEQARLVQVERQIVQAHKDIRTLETEFDTRANVSQLERWNVQLAMGAPAATQYLAGETALASLDADTLDSQQLAAVVTSRVPAEASDAPVPGELKVALNGKPHAPEGMASASDGKIARTEAVAVVSKNLLSAETVADLRARAQTEQLALR